MIFDSAVAGFVWKMIIYIMWLVQYLLNKLTRCNKKVDMKYFKMFCFIFVIGAASSASLDLSISLLGLWPITIK